MKALKDALADAKAILADPKNAKQADVDNALKTLTKAFGMLMENSMQKELTSKTST